MFGFNSLKKQNQRLSSILSAYPCNAYVFSVEGTCIDIFAGDKTSHPSFDLQKLVGMNFDEILSRKLSSRLKKCIQKSIESKGTQTIVHSLTPSDLNPEFGKSVNLNRTIWFEGKITPVEHPGSNQKTVLWISTDISDRVVREQKLKVLAERDELTGVNNRRVFNKHITKAFTKFKQNEIPTSVMMLDIDNFKEWNDRLGHVCGDRLLRHVAKTCEHNLNNKEVFCRYGGEEFAVVLPDTSYQQAIEIAEYLRYQLNVTPCQLDGTNVYVTISAGVATMAHDDYNCLQVISRADKATYQSKRLGKNMVSGIPTTK